jgi:hypothetical protein
MTYGGVFTVEGGGRMGLSLPTRKALLRLSHAQFTWGW